MYGLPIRLAVQGPGDVPGGLARVFHITLRTAERTGVQAEPPFDSATVGDSSLIRVGALPR